MVTKDLGMVTAYAYAVAGGYTGTEAEFTQLMADLAVVVDDFDNFSVNVTTLPAGSSATASYSDGVLSLGIPKGDKGDKGNTGDTGATPQLSIGTVTTTTEPSVTITGTAENPVLNFGLVKGDKGDTGEVSEAELTQAFVDFSENGTVANAEQLVSNVRVNDQTPYLFRTSGGSVDIGDREYINGIVGGTVAFNQLFPKRTASYTGTNYTIVSNDDGKFVITATATATEVNMPNVTYINASAIVANHIYAWLGSKSGITITLKGYSKEADRIFKPSSTSYSNVTFEFNNLAAGTYTLYPQLFDLTQMFGSTIADYIYSLEQATAGAGVAFFKTLFPKPYYAYNAGELKSVSGLVSHDMTGFNQWDEEWQNGTYGITNGIFLPNNTHLACKNPIAVIPNTAYHYETNGYNINVCYMDADMTFIDNFNSAADVTMVTPQNCHYIVFNMAQAYGTTYNHDICINLSWDGTRNGEYEPYVKHSYPLDDSLTLRGIPKLDSSNNLYYDGDTYESDGTVTRKYGIVDLGTLTWSYETVSATPRFYAGNLPEKSANKGYWLVNSLISNSYERSYNIGQSAGQDKMYGVVSNSKSVYVVDSAYTDATAFKTAMNGVYLVYELATPTTESADPYQTPQIVDDFGTEEFVLSDSVFPVPVGHNTDYPINLKAKVEMMPNSPSGDGDYIVRQTNGVNEYVSIANNATIQDILSRLEALEG